MKHQAESLIGTDRTRGISDKSSGPHFETIDFRFSDKVLRTKFILDATWRLERGLSSYQTKEGFVTTHEALKIIKKNPQKDYSLNIPVNCIPSLYLGLHKLMEARDAYFRKSDRLTHADKAHEFPTTPEGAFDFSELSQHGFPKYMIRLLGGYTLKIQEYVNQKTGAVGSYDTVSIRRSARKKDSEDAVDTGEEDKGGAGINLPLRLFPALLKGVDYIYE